MIKQKTLKQYRNTIKKELISSYHTINVDYLLPENNCNNDVIIQLHQHLCNQREEQINEECNLFTKEESDLTNEKIEKFNNFFYKAINKDKYECIKIHKEMDDKNYYLYEHKKKLKLFLSNNHIIQKDFNSNNYELIINLYDEEKIGINISEKYINVQHHPMFCENNIINNFLCNEVDAIVHKNNKFFKKLAINTNIFDNFIESVSIIKEIEKDGINLSDIKEEIEILKIKYDLMQHSEKTYVNRKFKP